MRNLVTAAAAVALLGTASTANAAPILYNLTLNQLTGNTGNGSGSFSIEGATFSKSGNEFFQYTGSTDVLLSLSFTIDGKTFDKNDSLGVDQVFFQNGNVAGLTYMGFDGGNLSIFMQVGALSYNYSFGNRVSQGTIVATPATTPGVPEPATWAMMIGGFGAIGGAMRYRRRKATVSYA